jgi:hypothetical protein
MKALFSVSLLLLAGCSTERDLLELRRDQLLRIEQNAKAVRQGTEQGSFDPHRYDAYLAVDADVFNRILSTVNGYSIDIEASGRPVTLSVKAFETNFRPGSPEIRLDVEAVDRRSGVRAAVKLDSRLIIEGDLQNPDKLAARIVATNMVPDLKWGPLDFTKARFVRSLLSLEASRYTEKLPAMTLPLTVDFAFGSPAVVADSGRIDTGNGSWIRGNISYPDTMTKGRFAVKNILFLNNGVHLFAMVEGV